MWYTTITAKPFGRILAKPCYVAHWPVIHAIYSAARSLFCYGVIIAMDPTRAGNGSARARKQSHPSSPVWLGEDRDAAQLHVFFASGYGAAAIRGAGGSPVAYVSSPGSVMGFATDIFTNQGSMVPNMMPAFTGSLVRIQQSLTKAVRVRTEFYKDRLMEVVKETPHYIIMFVMFVIGAPVWHNYLFYLVRSLAVLAAYAAFKAKVYPQSTH